MSVTRVQFVHQYPATSGGSGGEGNFPSNNTAGNLIVVKVSAGRGGAVTNFNVSDTLGNVYSSLPFLQFNGSKAIQIFYVLSCLGGANRISVSFNISAGDLGWTAVEYSNGISATWLLDSNLPNGSSFDGSSISNTPLARTNSWNVSAGVLFMGYADENTTQASHTPQPANFNEIQWDNGHIDGDADWLNSGQQTGIVSGWDLATSCNTWALYVASFTTVAGPTVELVNAGLEIY